jgi:hypothetical protein
MLAALTASALALPGLALPGLAPDALADGPTERWSLETATSFYAEDDVDSDKVSSGSTSRYEIQTQQFQLKAPFTERTDLGLNVTYESMSGATPWFVEPGPDGDPVQVMTGATVEEERIDVLGTGSYYLDNGRLSLSGGLSNEKDYFAGNGGVEAEIHFNEKSTSLTTGLGFSLDTLEPTDADLFATRPKEENRQSVSAFAGISQVIRRNMALQSSLSFQRSTGFLADPYKLVSVGGVNLADSRPDERNQIAWLTRYRHHFDRMNGTLHADYRFSLDDWEIYAHSVELAYYQTLWDSLRLIPSLRYYSQSQAEFYGPFFADLPSDGYASSDYRLSPFGALSWKLRAEAVLQDWPFHMDWRIGISWERYVSSGDLSLGRVGVENPGLVSFHLFSVNLTTRF